MKLMRFVNARQRGSKLTILDRNFGELCVRVCFTGGWAARRGQNGLGDPSFSWLSSWPLPSLSDQPYTRTYVYGVGVLSTFSFFFPPFLPLFFLFEGKSALVDCVAFVHSRRIARRSGRLPCVWMEARSVTCSGRGDASSVQSILCVCVCVVSLFFCFFYVFG